MPKPRHDGWTAPRQIDFLRALSRHGIVGRAADEAGMGVESAYRLRGRNEEFAEIWDQALEVARLVAVDRRAPKRR